MLGSHLMSRGPLGLMAAGCLTLFAAQGALAAPGDGQNRHIDLINDTNVAMIEFNASPVGSTSWEENILRGRQLPPGERVDVNVDNGTSECFYDLRAVFADGDKVERRKFNVCDNTYWRIFTR